MVKTQGPNEYDRLDEMIQRLCGEHGLRLEVSGWTRKTYDVLVEGGSRTPRSELVARIESFATTSGEVRVFDDRGAAFATDVGAALESDFGVAGAIVLRVPRPE